MHAPKLIGPFTQLLTFRNLPIKGALQDGQLEIIPQGGILVAEGKILAIDTFESLKSKATSLEHIEGDTTCIPGFVDAHTHICFAGSRAQDYAMRNAGKTYLEIAKAGGGIWDTVTKTRAASESQLVNDMLARCKRHLHHGVTTLEVKSGYGLQLEEELKMLRAIEKAATKAVQDIVPTCLAAHMVPRDWPDSPAAYLSLMADQLFPLLKDEGLTNRIYAFIEESAFSPEQIAPYFEAAQRQGFDLTVHADQFSNGGSAVAVQYGAVSADHLEASSTKEIELLAKSDVISVALPGASLGLGCDFTPARAILDQGGALAIASDHNPGSAPMGDLLTQASLLGTFQKLSNAEVLAGVTFRAAAALKLDDRGVLDVGKQADFATFPTNDYREITYHQGQVQPQSVWKNGNKAV